ncbi:MAG: hypothetical protein WC725_05010 [Patescibacteria group bacterium]|jgi:hypothetical protein
MATASFTKNFAVKSKNNAKKLANALDNSKNIEMKLSRPMQFTTGKELKAMFSKGK